MQSMAGCAVAALLPAPRAYAVCVADRDRVRVADRGSNALCSFDYGGEYFPVIRTA